MKILLSLGMIPNMYVNDAGRDFFFDSHFSVTASTPGTSLRMARWTPSVHSFALFASTFRNRYLIIMKFLTALSTNPNGLPTF
jgi:hypothetical protein